MQTLKKTNKLIMELTGKARKDFLKWLFNQEELRKYINSFKGCGVDTFNSIPFSMQYGVYVDWGDSVGIEIFLEDNDGGIDIVFRSDLKYNANGVYKIVMTRKEAQPLAIKKANEIYNDTK